MPRKRASDEGENHQTANALDRWEDEGGATRVISQALIAQISALTPSERQNLQCLGAAVVVRWTELPINVQRAIFKVASEHSGSGSETALAARIARFLHEHKNQ